MSVTGCAPRITPPIGLKDPVPIFIADYGRHTSLLLPDEQGGLVEFAWGDYPWFAQGHTGSINAISALFFSSGSALGVRHLEFSLPSGDLKVCLAAKRLLTFPVDADRADDLRDQLIDQFERHRDGVVFNPKNHMFFVHDDEHYWFAHNCNHLTAEWLEQLGCKVDGFVLYSNFKMADEK